MATPDAELKVRIEAELGNFASTLKTGEKDIESFGKRVDSELKKTAQTASASSNSIAASIAKMADGTAKSFSRLGPTSFSFRNTYHLATAKIIEESKRVSVEASKMSTILGGQTVKSSNQAAFAINNLSRVAQDAPFGFIGIQNNLNPLLESFQQLRKETGSNSLAFKAMVGALAGPAGLGLALGAVSAALLFYQEYQRKANKETKVAADANKELADSIKSISEVQQEGRKNASSELSQLQTLYQATQNIAIPQKERLRIAKEIIEKYPTYLQGMTSEGILAGEAAKQYESLTNAILAKGYAQAAEENRSKLLNQSLEANVGRRKEQIKLTKLNRQLENSSLLRNSGLLGTEAQVGLINAVADAAEKSRKSIAAYDQTIKTTSDEIKILDSVTQGLIATYGTDVLFDPDKPKKTSKEIKTVSDIFKALNIDLKQVEASVDGTFGDKSKERVSAFAKAIDELISIGIKPTDGIIKGLQDRLLGAQLPNVKNDAAKFARVVISNVQNGFDNAGDVEIFDIPKVTQTLISPFQQLNDYIGTQVFPQLQSGFENFFNDILEKGSFSFAKLGSAILKTFTSVLASEATRGLLDLLNPAQTSLQKGGKGLFSLIAGLGAKSAIGGSGAASAAGATAASGGILLPLLGGLAAGGLIASLFKKKQATPAPAFNSYSNNTSPISSDTFGGGSVVFQISGTNLIGVLNRAGAKLARFNGTP